MKRNIPQPPAIATDDTGRITNFTHITRWGYCNVPAYRKTDALSDLLRESYVARLERQVATLLITNAALTSAPAPEPAVKGFEPPASEILEAMRILNPTPARQLTVVSPSDNHEDIYLPNHEAAHVVGRLLVLGVVVAAIAVGIHAQFTGHGTVAAGAYVLGAIGSGYLMRKGGAL